MLAKYGQPAWFNLGDRDLATHLFRTQALRQGRGPTEVADAIRRALGVRARILPMTDDPVTTYVLVGDGPVRPLHFQEYLVQRGATDEIRIEFQERPRRPTSEVLTALTEAEAIYLAPSNPVASIGPILAIAGIRECLRGTQAPITPSVRWSGRSLKGRPTDSCAGPRSRSRLGVARLYHSTLNRLDGILIDTADADEAPRVQGLGSASAWETSSCTVQKRSAWWPGWPKFRRNSESAHRDPDPVKSTTRAKGRLGSVLARRAAAALAGHAGGRPGRSHARGRQPGARGLRGQLGPCGGGHGPGSRGHDPGGAGAAVRKPFGGRRVQGLRRAGHGGRADDSGRHSGRPDRGHRHDTVRRGGIGSRRGDGRVPGWPGNQCHLAAPAAGDPLAVRFRQLPEASGRGRGAGPPLGGDPGASPRPGHR
jgi:2-phospho-L-lactate transferase